MLVFGVFLLADYAALPNWGLTLLELLLAFGLILFVWRVLVAPDPVAGLTDEISAVPKFLLQGLLVAGLLGGIAGLIAAYTPRRAYATAAIIAVFIIPPIIVAIIGAQASDDFARIAVFLSPSDILDGTNAAIFGSVPDSPVVASLALPGWAYLVAAGIGILGSIALTVRRYLRIAA